MTEREKLVLHLQNLYRTNTRKATLDVVYLLEVLNALPPTEVKKPILLQNTQVDVDGGSFTE
jgi:hypothetical protein